MKVDGDETPTITIHQHKGEDLVFTLEDGKHYILQTNDDGQIENAESE